MVRRRPAALAIVDVCAESLPACGAKCCDPVILAVSRLQAQTWNPTDDDGRANKRFIVEDLTPLSLKEGRRRAPHIAEMHARGMRPSATPGGQPTMMWFYECRHFDPVSKRCGNYEGRPPICRQYPPWDEVGGPQASAILPFGCGYLADIPEDQRHAMYRETAE